MKKYIFLFASFISALGDAILLFSLPFGVSKEFQNLKLAPLFWLIPAVALFVSVYFRKWVHVRENSARLDYSLLLLIVGLLEVVIAITCFFTKTSQTSLILALIFVFFYAFIKEGISRLFYNVAIYRFFCTPEEYTHFTGLKGALDVIAAISGIILATFFFERGHWRYSMLLDALTFIVLTLCIYFVGKDAKDLGWSQSILKDDQPTSSPHNLWNSRAIIWILFSVPILHAVNSLFVNYLPLINEKKEILTVSGSLLWLAILRFPGLLLGLNYKRLSTQYNHLYPIIFYTCFHIAVSISYIIAPSYFASCLLMASSGLSAGLFSPAYMNILNQISHRDLVNFNSYVTRSTAVFQFTSCTVSILLIDHSLLTPATFLVVLSVFIALAYGQTKWISNLLQRKNIGLGNT